jgi:uncharacterized protein YodC (DUF2158 family)
MNPREFFLVEHRYIDGENTQDEWLFSSFPGNINTNGGLAIYHVDENYIEDHYAGTYFNTIMYDPDGDMFDDNVSHPGIVFEHRILGYDPYPNNNDLYTIEAGTGCNPIIYEGILDSIKRIDPSCYVINDTTSDTYNGLVHTDVIIETFDESGEIMETYMQVSTPLTVTIESPVNSGQYNIDEDIDFIETHENTQGILNCEWYEHYGEPGETLLSNECDFISTPYDLGLYDGSHDITLYATDGFTSNTAEVSIEINGLEAEILSPEQNSNYDLEENIIFSSSYDNSIGLVSCDWYSEYGGLDELYLSDQCNFSSSAYSLGLDSGSHEITLIVEDNISEVEKNVDISINPFSINILSPNQNQIYPYSEPLSFEVFYLNAIDPVFCEWHDTEHNILISTDCNFIEEPRNLGWGYPDSKNLYNKSSSDIFSSIFSEKIEAKNSYLLHGPFYPSLDNDHVYLELTAEDSQGNISQSSIDFEVSLISNINLSIFNK